MTETGSTNGGSQSIEHILLDYPTTSEETLSKRYSFSYDLGSGAYATVKYANCVRTHQPYAVKIISKTKIPKNYLRKFVPREVDALKKLSIHQHPFISQLREFFETPQRIYLVTKLALGGDLLNYINSRKYLNEDTGKRMIAQLLCALDHIHDLEIVHRDLKCENLLIGPEEGIIVTDFGFATQQPKNRLLTTFCGSYAYAAPEILAGSSYNGKCTDVWSVGVILYAMLNGKLPYNDTKPKNILAKIKTSPLVMTRQVSVACEKFVRDILTINAMERPLVSELLLKRWLEGSLKKILKNLPEKVHPSCFRLNLPQKSSFRMSDSSEECLRVFSPRQSGTSPHSPLLIAEEFIAHNSSHKTSSTISERVRRKYRQIKSNVKTWASRKIKDVGVVELETPGDFAEIETRTGTSGAQTRGGGTLVDIFDTSQTRAKQPKAAQINLKYAIHGRETSASSIKKPQVINISQIGNELKSSRETGPRSSAREAEARSASAAPPISNRRNTIDLRAKSCKPPHVTHNTVRLDNTTTVSITTKTRKPSQDSVRSSEKKYSGKATKKNSKQEIAINDQILRYLTHPKEVTNNNKSSACPQGLPPLKKKSQDSTRAKPGKQSTSYLGSSRDQRKGDDKRTDGKRRTSLDEKKRTSFAERRKSLFEDRRGSSYDKALLYHNIQTVTNSTTLPNRAGNSVTQTKVVPVTPRPRRSSQGSMNRSRKGSLEKKALAGIHELSTVYN